MWCRQNQVPSGTASSPTQPRWKARVHCNRLRVRVGVRVRARVRVRG